MGYQGHEELVVWQKAMDLVVAVISIPSNIAEGQARNSKKEFIQFLSIAQGSRAELQTQLLLCVKLGYVTEVEINDLLSLTEEVGKMLTTFILKLKTKKEVNPWLH